MHLSKSQDAQCPKPGVSKPLQGVGSVVTSWYHNKSRAGAILQRDVTSGLAPNTPHLLEKDDTQLRLIGEYLP